MAMMPPSSLDKHVDFLEEADTESEVWETKQSSGCSAFEYRSDTVAISLVGVSTSYDLQTSGATCWFGGRNLADHLLRCYGSTDNEKTQTVELGCGLGLAGLALAKKTRCRLVLTDGDESTLARAKENAARNLVSCECKQLLFGDSAAADRMTAENGGFDRCVAADVAYETRGQGSHTQVLPLFQSAAALLTMGGTFDVAFTRRRVPIEALQDAAKKCGFTEGVPAEESCYDMFGNNTGDELTDMWRYTVLHFVKSFIPDEEEDDDDDNSQERE